MFLADYHTHSLFSCDGNETFDTLFAAAAKAGLRELCVTDHCDMWAADFPAEERYNAFLEARERSRAPVKLLLGIELGEGLHDIPKAEAAVSAVPYDFIIGSYHALRNMQDFYDIRYSSEQQCRDLLARYFQEMSEYAEWGGFDVLGHIDYPLRYMKRDGFELSLLPFYERELRDLFAVLIRKGLGIEFNTKGPLPFCEVLTLYRQCGGEIVTVGSDAHRANAVGRGVADGVAMCREAGVKYITAFEQRRARYEKI